MKSVINYSLSITLERPYELAPGQRYCPCQFYVLARVKNMAAPTRLHKVNIKTYFYYNPDE